MRNLILVLVFLVFEIGFAQEGKIEGIILDGEFNNEPLAFANITVKDTGNKVKTDIDGKYSLKLKAGEYILVFDFIGYQNIKKKVVVKNTEILFQEEILYPKQISGFLSLK
jgi:CarboxypepD_reg-like domain